MLKLALFKLAPCKSKINNARELFPLDNNDKRPMLKYLRQSMARMSRQIRNMSRGVKNHFKAIFFFFFFYF